MIQVADRIALRHLGTFRPYLSHDKGKAVKTITVVGASVAGLEAARTLRLAGYDGHLIVVGDETDRPYDRPPLSKGFLDGSLDREAVALHVDEEQVELRLGTRADRLVASERVLVTSTGIRIRTDGVVLASGARARRLPSALGPRGGVHMLRTLRDAIHLREDLADGKRLVVIGGGFIGAEVASMACGLGLDVTIVEPQQGLLRAQLGATLGTLVESAHRDHGVRLEVGQSVESITGSTRVSGVRLVDGRELPADVVLIGVGSEPAIEWLVSSGLALGDGVLCDDLGRTSLPQVVAVGDCAAWTSPGEGHRRRQHWMAAIRQANIGARSLLGLPPEPRSADFDYIWSDQYDFHLQIAGRRGPNDACVWISGTPDDRAFTLAFRDRDGIVRSVASVNDPKTFAKSRRMLGSRARPT